MQEIINEAIIPMINDGLFSAGRLNSLIYIKSFIDRISSKNYIDKESVYNIQQKYGVLPNIITWGDYFQTEMACSLLYLTDNEFCKAVDTLKFDMISGYLIFSTKEIDFFNWVRESYEVIMTENKTDFSEDEKEILHLKILMDYYIELDLKNCFTDAEMRWYQPFKSAMVI